MAAGMGLMIPFGPATFNSLGAARFAGFGVQQITNVGGRMTKFTDSYASDVAFASARNYPQLVAYMAAVYNSLGVLPIAPDGVIEVPAPEPLDDMFYDLPVPVAITSRKADIKVLRARTRNQQTLDYVPRPFPKKKQIHRPSQKVFVNRNYKPYPSVKTPALPRIPVRITPRAVRVPRFIRQTKIQVNISRNRMQLIRKRTGRKRGPTDGNRKRHDKKSNSMLQYLASHHMASAGLHTVSEVLDFTDAVTGAMNVRMGGLWWNFGSLTWQQQRDAMRGMISGEYQWDFDFQLAARNLLMNQAIDMAIGQARLAERATVGNHNYFGDPSTWVRRIL